MRIEGEGRRGVVRVEGPIHVNCISSNLVKLFCVPVYSKFTFESLKDYATYLH